VFGLRCTQPCGVPRPVEGRHGEIEAQVVWEIDLEHEDDPAALQRLISHANSAEMCQTTWRRSVTRRAIDLYTHVVEGRPLPGNRVFIHTHTLPEAHFVRIYILFNCLPDQTDMQFSIVLHSQLL